MALWTISDVLNYVNRNGLVKRVIMEPTEPVCEKEAFKLKIRFKWWVNLLLTHQQRVYLRLNLLDGVREGLLESNQNIHINVYEL